MNERKRNREGICWICGKGEGPTAKSAEESEVRISTGLTDFRAALQRYSPYNEESIE